MTVNALLLPTLFARAPTTPAAAPGDEPAQWLIIQPFVQPADLDAWIAGAGTPGTVKHSFIDPAGMTDDEINALLTTLVPLPLPPGMAMTVRRLNAANQTVGADLVNDRGGVQITNPALFQADNVRPGTGQNLKTPAAAPYAQAFYDQIKDIRADANYDADKLKSMLTLYFRGGSVRRFRDNSVTNQDAVNLFSLNPRLPVFSPDPYPADPIRTVSLASACGLMVRLDKDIGLAGLQGVDHLELYLRDAGGQAPGDPVPFPPDETTYLKAYFAAINPNAFVPAPSSLWATTLLPDSASRVYVLPHRTGLANASFCFGLGGADQRTLFRRDLNQTSAEARAKAVNLSDVESIGIYRKSTSPNEPPPDGPATVNISFYELLQARLVAYRSSTAAQGSPSLWQLVPLPSDRDRFVSLFSAIAAGAAAAAWPNQFTLHGRDGKRIEFNGTAVESGFVGAYVLPWDDAGNADPATLLATDESLPTVLFWFALALAPTPGTLPGAIPKSVDVTLAMQIPGFTAPAGLLSFGSATNPTGGPVWEWVAGGGAPVLPWSAISLDDSTVAARAIPAFVRTNDYVLQPALSARRIEGVLQVDYPGPPPGQTKQTLTAADANPLTEFKRELVAYRKLNVYAQVTDSAGTASPLQALNPWSNMFPVWWKDLVDGRHRNVFSYRFMSDIYSPPTDYTPTPGALSAPQAYFAAVYPTIGGSRQIIVDLEHTTGHAVATAIDGGTATTAMTHDGPPLLPSSLRRFLPKGANALDESPFLTVSFAPAADGKPERVLVSLDPRYLNPGSGVDAGVLTSAWRSIAELAYAASIRLRGQFRQFHFADAVAKARANSNVLALLDGLVPVAGYEDEGTFWAFPAADGSGGPGLQAAARAWLAGQALPAEPITFEVPLTLAGAPPIAQSCHVVEFWLEVVRDMKSVPARDGSTFVRLPNRPTADQLFGESGEQVVTIASTDATYDQIKVLYSGPGGFVDQISGAFVADANGPNGWRSISPTTAAQATAQGLRSLIGSSPTPDPTARDWIVPGTAFEGGDPISVALLPLAFRPLADRYAGTASYAALCRYMQAVEMLIDARPGRWSDGFTTPTLWQGWFKTLTSAIANIASLVKSIYQLVVPAYLADGAPAGTLDGAVADLITAWDQSSGGVKGGPNRVRRMVLAKPSLFAESRALLVTRLSAPNSLPPDFLRAQSLREIVPPQWVGNEARIERSTLSLTDTLLDDAGPTAIGFVEVLGNEKYDFQFAVDTVKAYGIEAFLASNLPDPSGALPIEGVHVPSLAAESATSPRIDLPSRQPLVSPVHLYTDLVDGIETKGWANTFAAGFSVNALLKQKVLKVPSNNEPTLILRAANTDFARSTNYDIGVVASLFYITSDEQNEFENDAFYFALQTAPGEAATALTAIPPTANVVALFKQLEQNAVLTDVDGLANALDNDTVGFVNQALVPPAPTPDFASQLVISIEKNGASETLNAPPGYGAALFRAADGDTTGPARHLLIITWEIEVWDEAAVSLYQTRNQLPPEAGCPPYNRKLWQFSPVVGDTSTVAIDLVRAYDQANPITLTQDLRSTDPVKIVNTLLGARLTPPIAGHPTWTGPDLSLSIVVNAVHRVAPPVLYADGQVRDPILLSHGQLPLWNAFASSAAAMTGEQVVFDPSRKLFSVDFTWTTKKNVEILRIPDVLVQF